MMQRPRRRPDKRALGRIVQGVAVLAVLVAVLTIDPDAARGLALHLGPFFVRFWPAAVLLLLAAVLAVLSSRLRTGRPAGRNRREGLRLPLLAHVGLLLAVSLAVLVGAGTLLWTAVGKPSPAGEPAAAWTVTNTFDAVKILLAVVAGIGGVVALTVAYRRQHLGESAERREDTKLFNDRFAKVAELIGSDKAAVRLAGIYAAAALADDWAEGRQTCVDVLCAYLRMPYTPPTDQSFDALNPPGRFASRSVQPPDPAALAPAPAADSEPPDKPLHDPYEERQVRYTVIRLIRDHLLLPAEHRRSWAGCDLDFTGALFDGGDFAGATFSGGSVAFVSATFSGGWIDFAGATFAGGKVDFAGATFAGGTVDFAGATFAGGTVDFAASTFSGGTVDFAGATFAGGTVDFRGARFSRGTAHFGFAKLSGTRVHFSFAGFSGTRVDFGLATFSGGTVDFGGATFSGGTVTFGGATFAGTTAVFRGATFSGGRVDLGPNRDARWTLPPEFDAGVIENPPPGLEVPPCNASTFVAPAPSPRRGT